MGCDSFAVFSCPSFDISLHRINRSVAAMAPTTTVADCPANKAVRLSLSCSVTDTRQSLACPTSPSCCSSASVSSSPLSPTSPPLSPRSQFAALTVRIPTSPSSSVPTSRLALPTLPTTLTDPSQLRLFWPHHYYGADVDRVTAPLFQEWKQRPFYLAALRQANRRDRRCLRCNFNPKLHTPNTAPLTPPVTAVVAGEGSRRPSTPPVVSSGGMSGGFIECVRAPRKPWYSAEFMKELSRREKESTSVKESEKGRKRLREEDEEREEEGIQTEGVGEQPTKKSKPVSWEAEEVNTLKVWSGLPPLPTSPTKLNKRPVADSRPLLTLPLSPTPSSSVLSSSTSYPSTSSPSVPPLTATSSTAAASTSLPLSPVSVLCGSMGHLLSSLLPLSPRNDVRPPVQFQRMSHSPLFRKQRRVLPPVPKMGAV